MEAADSSRKKRTRRRSYTRKAPLSNSLINMAEARREIVNALQLHRASSANSPSPSSCYYNKQKYYPSQYLTESIPIPEPTWSTTAPAVLCAPVPTMDVLEVEWFDNLSSSHSWWIAFLNSLDGAKNGSIDEVMESSKECLDATNVDKSASDANDQTTSPFLDDWVIFPETQEQV